VECGFINLALAVEYRLCVTLIERPRSINIGEARAEAQPSIRVAGQVGACQARVRVGAVVDLSRRCGLLGCDVLLILGCVIAASSKRECETTDEGGSRDSLRNCIHSHVGNPCVVRGSYILLSCRRSDWGGVGPGAG